MRGEMNLHAGTLVISMVPVGATTKTQRQLTKSKCFKSTIRTVGYEIVISTTSWGQQNLTGGVTAPSPRVTKT